MGNCISKISKDNFFAYKEYFKNETSLEKGKIRRGLDMVTGGTYTRTHSIKGLSKKETLDPIQTGMWWRHFFKNGLLHEVIPNSVISYHDGKAVYISESDHMKRYSMLS